MDNWFSPRLKFQLTTVCPVTPVTPTFNCKGPEAGEKTLISIDLLLRLVSKTAQMPATKGAQPCSHRARSRDPREAKLLLRFWKTVTGRMWQFLHSSSPSRTTYTNSVLKSVRTFLKYAPSSSLCFLFSCISIFCCWLDLTVEVLNNRSRSNPLLTQIWEPVLIRFRRSVPDFGTQKNSDTYLNQTSWGWTIPSTKTLRGPMHAWARAHQHTGASMPTVLKAIPTYRTSTLFTG